MLTQACKHVHVHLSGVVRLTAGKIVSKGNFVDIIQLNMSGNFALIQAVMLYGCFDSDKPCFYP